MSRMQVKEPEGNVGMRGAFDSFCREFGLPKDILGGPGALSGTLLAIRNRSGSEPEAMRDGMLRHIFRGIRDDPMRYEKVLGSEKVAQIKDAYVSLVLGRAVPSHRKDDYTAMDRKGLMGEYASHLEIAISSRGVIGDRKSSPEIRSMAFGQTLPHALEKMSAIAQELRRRDPQDEALPSLRMGIGELQAFLKDQKERMAMGRGSGPSTKDSG